MAIYENITAHRNGCLREWNFNLTDNTLHDLTTGEITHTTREGLEILKSDLKRQGFRLLPYNPDRVEMSHEMREDFRKMFGY